jgi:hypothetical protein
MKCPTCGFEQADERLDCEACGLIFAKWRERHAVPQPMEAPPRPSPLKIPDFLKDDPLTKLIERQRRNKNLVIFWGVLAVLTFVVFRGEIAQHSIAGIPLWVIILAPLCIALTYYQNKFGKLRSKKER